MILAAMIIARNPLQYGFEVMDAEPIAYDKVAIPRAVDIRRVAEWAGTSVDEIQSLNPELRRWTTPVKYPEYEVKVPVGSAERLSARLSEAAPSDFTTLKWYTVKRGDTLLNVARKFGVSRAELADANNLKVKSAVRAGQELIIPRAPATMVAARAERAAPNAVASRSSSSSAPAPEGRASQQVDADHLSRQARRHALVDRGALRYERRQDQELEPAARQLDRGRHEAEDSRQRALTRPRE